MKLKWKDGIIVALTPAKNFLKSFMISPIFPTVLIGVVTVIKLLFDSIPTIHWVIAIVFLLIWLVIRWSLEPRLELIKQYKSLMNPLEKLTTIHSSTSVWQVVMNTLRNKGLRRCWVYYFDETGKNVNTAFYDLNAELEKLISNPYRLLNKNTLSIGGKFKSLVRDNEKLYEKFIEMINTENIHKDAFSYEVIKKEHNEFYSLLKQSRNNFAELRVLFRDEFFSPLPEPRFPSKPVVY